MRLRFVLVMTIVAVMAFGGVALARHGGSSSRIEFEARLRGENEVPVPVETRTRGEAEFVVKDGEIHYELEIKRAENIFGAAGAHIHCAPEGVNGPVVLFLAGPIAGGLDGTVKIEGTLDVDNIVDPACGTTIEELVQSMKDGLTYVNAHSTQNPNGEVRGQIEED